VKLRHAAALALVGWYLMVPPTRCCSSAKGDPNYDILCGAEALEGPTGIITSQCGADISASLDQWVLKGSYDTARECDAAAPHVTAKDSLGNSIPGRCVATDDPRLKGN